MATIVTLAEAKAHLRITDDLEDDSITLANEAAYDYIEKFLGNSDIITGDSPASYPAAIKQAALLIIAGLFENRQWQLEKTSEVNPAVMNLLYPYRYEIGI